MKNKYVLLSVLVALLVALGVLGGCLESQPESTASGCGCLEPINQPLPDPPQPAETNGSRLRPYQLVASDGTTSRVHGRYHDTLLDVSCRFVSPSYGLPERCLPEDAAWLHGNYFNDAACSAPIAFVDKCGSTPPYVRLSQESGCFQELIAYYKVIGLPANSTDIWWKSPDNGSCIKQTNPSTNSILVLIGDPLPWETFVSASVEPIALD